MVKRLWMLQQHLIAVVVELVQLTDGPPRPGLTASDGSAATDAARPSDADISPVAASSREQLIGF
jgi:hypothetical protein